MHIKKISKSWAEAWLLPVAIVVLVVGAISLILDWYIAYAFITEVGIIFFYFSLRREQRIGAWLVPVTVVVLVIGGISTLAHWYIVYTMFLELGIVIFFFALRGENIFVKGGKRPKFLNLIFTGIILSALFVILVPMGIVSLPIIYFLPETAFRIALWIAETATFLSGLPVRFYGRKNLPTRKQCVVIANHETLFDLLFTILIMRLRPWTVIYAKKVEKVPIIGQLLMMFGVPLYHDDKENYRMTPSSKKKMEGMLDEENKSLFVYANGRRLLLADLEKYPDLKILPLDPGAVVYAWKRGLPVVPCVIYGGLKVKPRYGQSYINSGAVTICIGEAIETKGRKPKELVDELWKWMDMMYRKLEIEALTNKKSQRPMFKIRFKWFLRKTKKEWAFFMAH
jgi:1-acyl-sn-glycerol-3-phosphate acyltransferase